MIGVETGSKGTQSGLYTVSLDGWKAWRLV